MKTSRVIAVGMAAGAALASLLASGCAPHPDLPEGGVDPQTLAQRNSAGQAQVYQNRKAVDPALQAHQGGAPNSSMEAGQAAAMQARMQAQQGH